MRKDLSVFCFVFQDPLETLGISVAGGVNNPQGDIPIYVSNINPEGCLGKSEQIQVKTFENKFESLVFIIWASRMCA